MLLNVMKHPKVNDRVYVW